MVFLLKVLQISGFFAPFGFFASKKTSFLRKKTKPCVRCKVCGVRRASKLCVIPQKRSGRRQKRARRSRRRLHVVAHASRHVHSPGLLGFVRILQYAANALLGGSGPHFNRPPSSTLVFSSM